jgi:hypothetical protein
MKPEIEKGPDQYKKWSIAVTWRIAPSAGNKIFQISGLL